MSARDTILVTGGAGFIGSHFARAAHDAGSRVVVLDNLSSALGYPYAWPALPSAIERVRGDVVERDRMARLIERHRVTAIVHFAGKICVGESIAQPALYYEQNVVRSLALLDVVSAVGPRVLVFSSSAAVYGVPEGVPIVESARRDPINPYGATKLAIEHAIAAYGSAHGIAWAALRYFNAAGAHPDGTLRESHEPETHLIPLAIDAALGGRPPLLVCGDDYATRDGTCERDYVHVCDLAEAHLAAIDVLERQPVGAINIGSGRGYTVLEVLETIGRVIGTEVPFTIGARREGDPPVLIASIDRARAVLGWQPRRSTMEQIIADALRARRAGGLA